MEKKHEATANQRVVHRTRNSWSGFLFGVGLVAFIDEAVFHQLLHWHHFYDKSTTAAGLVSDGLFHAFSWFATIASLFMVADLRRRGGWWVKRWLGGVLLGAGRFSFMTDRAAQAYGTSSNPVRSEDRTLRHYMECTCMFDAAYWHHVNMVYT